MTDLKDYYDTAQGLMDWYSDRNTLYANIDAMFYMDWDFPSGMPDWVVKVVSTEPHDAILTTVRTFATLKPRFKVMPMLANEANRNRANEIETAIAYNFKQASRRNDASVTWDVMLSASLYAEVAAQVIYLPYQEKILQAMGKDTRRVKASRRFGDFAFIIHNPANVYPEWSEYGLEGVMTVRVQEWSEFVASWGNLAEKLNQPQNKNGQYLEYVTVYDYINYEKRCVWAVCNDSNSAIVSPQYSNGGFKVLEEENKLGFIPYAIKRWGNSLSTDPQQRVMPLLQSIYNSGQWDMLNSFESLDASLTIARAAKPEYAGEFPPGQEPEVDNTEPSGTLRLPAGTRNFTPLPPQQIDNRLSMQKNEKRNAIWQSSVSRILNTLDFGSGTAYSSVNQVLSQAANSLSPYKILGEKAHAELAHQMLCWLHYYGKEYGDVDLYGQYDDKSRMGKEVRISSKTIDPDALDIEVILTPDMPVDKLQQVNAAVVMYQNFRVPQAELLEDLGLGDPNELAERRDQEDYNNAYIQTDLKRIADSQALETAQAQMEMQAGIQQQQQEQQMAAEQQRMEAEAQAAASQNASPAQEQMGGLMNNPAAGGNPPVTLARGQR